MRTRIGLTGGMASGKSTVAAELARLGCHVIEADKLGHQAIEQNASEIERLFGTTNRKQLASIVFDDKEKLKRLNAVIHPAVQKLADAQIQAIHDPSGILIYEAAILVETGGYRNFDKLIVAVCPEELQIERAMARDQSMTREQVEARLRNQMPLSEKVRLADYVIDTSGTMEHTLEQTRSVFESIRNNNGVNHTI